MSADPHPCCSAASPELKLYQAFIFSVPIFFTFILLLLFYLFYLRRRRVDWSSLRMRNTYQTTGAGARPSASGLKKEVREMLPVIIFKESFLVKDTQCSVCLGDYQANDRLQQIPSCGHTFHMECIDHWLAKNTTCPLCRVSLLPSPKASSVPFDTQEPIQSQRDSHFPSEMNIDRGVRESDSGGLSSERNEDETQHRPSVGSRNEDETQHRPSVGSRNEEETQHRPSVGSRNKDETQHGPSVGSVVDIETCTSSKSQLEDFQIGTKDAEVEQSRSDNDVHCHCALEKV
ncbi:RING-H2 finger protein ATL7-like [Aristolochia californica]|uniref:RING-H2 finger protein ATL7-like n=1 Tax=Aristolochia californica TaxID=171875 RepID=UPI0035DA9825